MCVTKNLICYPNYIVVFSFTTEDLLHTSNLALKVNSLKSTTNDFSCSITSVQQGSDAAKIYGSGRNKTCDFLQLPNEQKHHEVF